MTTLRQAAQQALEALERYQVKRQDFDRFADEIAALRETLAQPEQEPVADGNKVICPACCHQFRAIPTAVQTLMLNAGFEPPFVTPPEAQPEQEPVAFYHPHKGFYWAKPTHISAPTVVDVPPVPLYAAAERNNG